MQIAPSGTWLCDRFSHSLLLQTGEDCAQLSSEIHFVRVVNMKFLLGLVLYYYNDIVIEYELLCFPRRPSVSRDCGTLRPRTQLLLVLGLSLVGWTCCGALSILTAFLFHLYRVSVCIM